MKTTEVSHSMVYALHVPIYFSCRFTKFLICFSFIFGPLPLNCFKLAEFYFILQNWASTKHQKKFLILQDPHIKVIKTNYKVKYQIKLMQRDQIEKKKSYGIVIKKAHELPSWPCKFILDFGKKKEKKELNISWSFKSGTLKV